MAKLLITADIVKTLTSMTANVDPNSFESSIEIAQLNYIKPKIGKNLYNELVSQNSANTLTSANQILMGYIRKALAWYVIYVSIPDLDIKIRNKGLVRENSESSANIDQSSVDYFRNDKLSKANTYLAELIEYLEDNASTYPLYETGCEEKKYNPPSFRIIGGYTEEEGWLDRD